MRAYLCLYSECTSMECVCVVPGGGALQLQSSVTLLWTFRRQFIGPSLNHAIVKNLITRLSVSPTAPPLAKQPPAGRRRHLQHSLRGPATALQRNQPPQALQPARLRQRLYRVRQPSFLYARLGHVAQLSRLRGRRPLSDFEAGDQWPVAHLHVGGGRGRGRFRKRKSVPF